MKSSEIEWYSRKEKDQKNPITVFITEIENGVFLVLSDKQKIRKIEGRKILDSDINELNKILSSHRGGRVVMDAELMKLLKKELGDFEINF